jgi:hypothetical protein
LAHCGPTGAAPIMLGVEPNDIDRLSAALRAVGNELDALSQRVHALAAGRGDDAAMRCAGDCPHAAQYRDALRDAVAALERTRTSFKSKELGALRRSLESLLYTAPR